MGYCEISASANPQQLLENGNGGAGGGGGLEGQQSGRAVPQYTLYVIATSEKERSEWIRAIRQGETHSNKNDPKNKRDELQLFFFLVRSINGYNEEQPLQKIK